MANITGDQSTLNQTLDGLPAGIVEFFSALNIFLSITASLGNALILVALPKVSSIHPPTKLFFRCLAVTDLSVGLILQPLYAINIMSHITNMSVIVSYCVYEVREVLSSVFCTISLLTSTAIAVDRLLALLLGLRYRHVVTLRRVRVVVICCCLICASLGCVRVWRRDIASKGISVVIMLSLVTSVFCYTRIHLKLRHQHTQVHNFVSQGQLNKGRIPLNIAKYKKSVSSIFWVQLALIACYVPFGIVAGLYVNLTEHYVAWKTTATLLYLNSSLNPILYCWKIREVRQAAKDTIRQLYGGGG